MKLVIGGRAQGKTEYALHTFGFGREEISSDPARGRVLVHLERLVRALGAEETLRLLEPRLGKSDFVICCDEVGLGIVPAEREEREYRDAVGLVLCRLAVRAERVVRVFAGIGQVLR